MQPDARKTLDQLHVQWDRCIKCQLGVQRESFKGNSVHGEGVRRGIMFIGDGPGIIEEECGRPFVGTAGKHLRRIFNLLGLTDYYFTNLVACRACEHVTDETGQPRFRQRRKGPPLPMLRDVLPAPLQWKECLPRLQEEIYLVDPVVIVSIGGTAAEALTGKHITINRDRGQTFTISIPGAGHDAVLTEKKKEWYHKVRGEVVAPTVQSQVQYLLIPTLPMFIVHKKMADRGPGNPFQQVVEDIRKAMKIYEMYLQEAFHQVPSGKNDITWEELETAYNNENEEP